MSALVIHVTDPDDAERVYHLRFDSRDPEFAKDRLAYFVALAAEMGRKYDVDPTTAIWTAETERS